MSGTAIAQVIGFALMPVISRLFNPDDFGVLGSFNSFMLVANAAVTMQYAQAIMLPKKHEDAANVLAISIITAFLITFSTLCFSVYFSDWLLKVLEAPQAKWMIWFLPVAVLVRGINQSFQAWCIRRKEFKKTAVSQIYRSLSTGTIHIMLGLLGSGGRGLITGSVSGNGIATINLAHQVFGKDRELITKSLCWRVIKKYFVEYRDFPFYSAPQSIMNALSNGLPVLLLSYYYDLSVAGAYAFGLKLIHIPMSFVLTALRQVLFQRVSEAYNDGQKLLPLFFKSTLGLLVVSIVPSIFIFIFAPTIFVWVFGDQWYTAGEFSRWLIIWMIVAFSNVPSTLFARVLRKQKGLFIFEVFQLLFRIVCLVLGGVFLSSHSTVILFSIAGALMNLILIIWIACSVKRHHLKNLKIQSET